MSNQKSNEILSFLPFLSKQTVSVPGGTTRVRTDPVPVLLLSFQFVSHGGAGGEGGILPGSGCSWAGDVASSVFRVADVTVAGLGGCRLLDMPLIQHPLTRLLVGPDCS